MDRRKRTARTVALMSLFTMTDTQTNVPIASFVGDGSDLISLIVGIEPIQAGSGDPSPDNVRPISGWTGANIHVSPTTDAADGTTYPITFPSSAGTVYGGTLDVTTGKLTVDRAMVDLGTLTWTKESNHFYSIALSSAKPPVNNTVPAQIVCSAYQKASAYSVTQEKANGTIGLNNSKRLYIFNNAYTDAASLTASLSGVMLVYELATPIVYDLTPTEINTRIGTNNIWADTGEIKYIEYNV